MCRVHELTSITFRDNVGEYPLDEDVFKFENYHDKDFYIRDMIDLHLNTLNVNSNVMPPKYEISATNKNGFIGIVVTEKGTKGRMLVLETNVPFTKPEDIHENLYQWSLGNFLPDVQ